MNIFAIYSLVLALSILSLSGCGSSKKRELESPEIRRKGKAITLIDREFNDEKPSISRDGSAVVFLSGRAPHNGSYRAYRWIRGVAESPVRLTNQNDFEELDVVVSPDGLWTAVFGYPVDGTVSTKGVRLMIQSINDQSRSLVIELQGKLISSLSFSYSSIPVLSYVLTNHTGEKSLQLIEFSEDSSGLIQKSLSTIDDFSANESMPSFQSNTAFTGIVSLESDGRQLAIIRRSWTSGSTLGARQTLAEGLTDLLADGFSGGELGLTFGANPSESTEPVVPTGDKPELGFVYPQNLSKLFTSNASSSSVIPTKFYRYVKSSIAQAGRLGVFLGDEVFACNAAGENQDFFGTSFFLYDGQHSQSLVITKGDPISAVAASDCSFFVAEKSVTDQPVDFAIQDFALASSFENNSVNLAYQTWDTGDYEIHHLSFNFSNGQVSNVVHSKVSNATKP